MKTTTKLDMPFNGEMRLTKQYTMPDGEIVEREVPLWKTPFNHDTNFESERTGLFCKDPSLTKQEFKEESDINVILERFQRGGDLPPPVLPEHFTDLSERPTYFDIQSRLAQANTAFYQLNAKIRSEHLNDPARWADAVVAATNAQDGDALLRLGLTLEAEKPQTAKEPRSPPTGTPAAGNGEKPSEAPKGAPKSDTGK